MNGIKIMGVVALTFGYVQVAQADGFNRGIDDCRVSNRGDRSDLRSCLESGRDRILSALSEVGDGGGPGQPGPGSRAGARFVPDRLLSGLTARTRVTWGEVVRENGAIKRMTQYEAFEYCLSLNRNQSMREQILDVLGYDRTTGRWEQELSHRQVTDSEERDHLRRLPAGAIYLPARADFAHVRPRELRVGVRLFWSSSVHPYDSDYAYDFGGRSGYVGNVSRDSNVIAVRCVRR